MSPPDHDQMHTQSKKSTVGINPNEKLKVSDDSLFFPIPRFKELVPDLEELINIPAIHLGSFLR